MPKSENLKKKLQEFEYLCDCIESCHEQLLKGRKFNIQENIAENNRRDFIIKDLIADTYCYYHEIPKKQLNGKIESRYFFVLERAQEIYADALINQRP